MLKVRLQGSKNDIKAFIKILKRCAKITIVKISAFIQLEGTEKYYKVFIDLKRNKRDENEYRRSKERTYKRIG